MHILILGGTKFVGRHIVEQALLRGHEITILQRGQTNKELFAETKKFYGDRIAIQNILPDKNWDAVIDTCGYHPEDVKRSAEYLKGRCHHYIFISTISVYADFSKSGINEKSSLSHLNVPLPERDLPIAAETYGPLKALCEEQVLKYFPDKSSLLIRPGIIAGAHDPTHRFDYWINAFLSGKNIRAPDDDQAPFSVLDVRALAQWAIDSAEKRRYGIYNLVGPKKPITLKEFLLLTAKIIPSAPIDWISLEQITEGEFPLYYPREYWGAFQICAHKAYDDSLADISLEETIRSVVKFLQQKSCN